MEQIPFITVESQMARMERTQKRLAILVMIQSVIIGVFLCLERISDKRTNK